MDVFTKAMPTDGETPRASQTAQTMVWASPIPRTDEALVARDFRPEAVLGRLSEVNISDWVQLCVDSDIELAEECTARCCLEVATLGVLLFCGRWTARECEDPGVSLREAVELVKYREDAKLGIKLCDLARERSIWKAGSWCIHRPEKGCWQGVRPMHVLGVERKRAAILARGCRPAPQRVYCAPLWHQALSKSTPHNHPLCTVLSLPLYHTLLHGVKSTSRCLVSWRPLRSLMGTYLAVTNP